MSPSLQWVAWASLPHLHRYYAPRRLPLCPSRVASLVARFPIPCLLQFVRGVPSGLMSGSKLPDHARAFDHPVPQSGNIARRQMALPSSRVTPVDTCPALRPRWGPIDSPIRLWDCCLPAQRDCRLSPLDVSRDIRLPTTLTISGLHHAACILDPSSLVRPLLGLHVEFTTDLLARL